MQKQWKGFVVGVIIATFLTCGWSVLGESLTKSISVMYDNIEILIDGVEYVAKDANGNVVEPFIYNGTTYLPVRGIANAFCKDVSWEPQTSTVKLGAVDYDWLDQMGYVNYETTGNENTIAAIEEGTKLVDKIKYNRGISFRLGYSKSHGAKEANDDSLQSYQNVEYLLNNQYKTFSGKLNCIGDDYSDINQQKSIVKIYGDGNLLYTSPPLTNGTKTINFDIDVSNYKLLKINASIPNLVSDYHHSVIGFAEARLSKK